jgi:hypothetical protein
MGTDYNILMTARLREEMLAGKPVREAVSDAVRHVTAAIGAAGLVLASSFGTLMLEAGESSRGMSFALAFEPGCSSTLTGRPPRWRLPSRCGTRRSCGVASTETGGSFWSSRAAPSSTFLLTTGTKRGRRQEVATATEWSSLARLRPTPTGRSRASA